MHSANLYTLDNLDAAQINTRGVSNARSFIRSGKIDFESPWSF